MVPKGTLLALGALLVVVVAAVAVERRPAPVPESARPTPSSVRQDDLAGFSIERPDLHLQVERSTACGGCRAQPWRPRRAMIRRVARIHDLDARADVAAGDADVRRYGLDDDAARIGRPRRRAAAAVPGGRSAGLGERLRADAEGAEVGERRSQVYVVKKAAMDVVAV
ncbi:MAG: hypothetical protein R3F59_10215 [Myxococcota bacterium]